MFGDTNMVRTKARRKSGYITPQLTISKKELVIQNLFLNEFYDDWEDWRDGFRDWYKDFKTIKNITVEKKKVYGEKYDKRMRMNEKQKNLLCRRKLRKMEEMFK